MRRAVCVFLSIVVLTVCAAERPLKTPCRISFTFDGVGATVESWGISINTKPHWANKSLMQSSAYYIFPTGGSTRLGHEVCKRGEKIDVVLTHYSDHSSVEVKNCANGKTIGYAPLVLRTNMKRPAYLKIKEGEEFVKDLKIDESIADAPIDDKPPVAPDGYVTVFSDHFPGETENWGAKRTTPGILSIPKKSYFCYSYPILVPGLKVDDGLIRFAAFIEDATTLAVRFRASEHGDAYYYVQLSGSKESRFFRKEVGKPAVAIGMGSKLKARGRVSFELAFTGNRMSVRANGKEIVAAEDATFGCGGVYLCGSSDSETRLFAFDVFGKKGGKTSWTPVKEEKKTAESSVKDVAMPEPIAAYAERGDHADKNFLWHEGRPYVPLAGSDGQYFLLYEPAAIGDERVWDRIRDGKILADIRKYGLTWQGVFLRLVDYIDPTRTDHAFTEDYGLGGVSRVMDIAGDKFRVTSARRGLIPYFSYTTCVRTPRKMHVVGVLVPNDVERYLGVFPLPNESGSFGVATGRTFPLDGKNYFTYACYYPRDVKTEWIFLNNIFRKYVYEPLHWEGEKSGAAIGGLWMMEPVGNETDYLPKVTPPKDGEERQLGDYFQRAGFIFSNFGVKANIKGQTEKDRADRIRAFGAWLDHARFAGCNNAQVCWLGTDWLIHKGDNNNIGYDTKLFAKYKKVPYDYVTELCPELSKRGMKTLASTATYNIDNFAKSEYGFTDEDLRVKGDGEPDCGFGTQKLEPASERVKRVYCDILKELALKVKDEACVEGIAISIDGFFTFAGGWGELPLKRFEKECGVKLPSYLAAEAHTFVTNNPPVLAKWYDWRAKDTKKIVCRLRDTIRAVNPNWALVVRILTDYSYRFKKDLEDCQREALLKEGVDPDLFKDEEGIVFVPRSFYEHKVSMLPGEWSYKYEHGVTDIPTKFGTGHHQWTGYWESPGMFTAFSKYTYGWLGCPNTLPVGRASLDTFLFHLANENIRMMTYQAWESALEQSEHLLRRIGAAYRALPIAEPKVFGGRVGFEGDLAASDVKIAWYGDRLAIINPTNKAGTITLKDVGTRTLKELGRQRLYESGFFVRSFEIDVEPYDLLVFEKQ